MKTWVSDGDNIPLAAPAGGTVAGQPCLIGDFFGVANETKVAGQIVGIVQFGVFSTQPKTTGEAWAIGDKLWFDTGTAKFTNSGGGAGRFLGGYAAAAALSAATTATVIYNQGGR